MYEAKGERASHIYLVRTRVANGELVEITNEQETDCPEADVSVEAGVHHAE